MRLLVGLGNPGSRYAMTRHNVGFMAIDAIAQRYRFAPCRAKFQGAISEGAIGDVKVLALKPETYMNASGDSVGAAAAPAAITGSDRSTRRSAPITGACASASAIPA